MAPKPASFARVGIIFGALLLLTPGAALAQSAVASLAPSAGATLSAAQSGSAAPASPAQQASAPAAQAAGGAQPAGSNPAAASAAATGSTVSSSAPATGSAAPAAAPASPAAAPAPGGVATPVGSNPITASESQEPVSYFAYLLIALAVIWFLAAIAGIVRLLLRPQTGPFAAPMPPNELDRPYLTFILPFASILTVAVIVVGFGTLFLGLSTISDVYPLAVDLFIVCLVMLIATTLALRRPRGGTGTAVH
jgi:hypothetical protein